MWREFWRRSLLAVVALAVAGCTNGAAETTTTVPDTTTTTTAPSTTTAPPTTTSTVATTTTAATEAVGSVEALEAEVEGVREFLVLLYPDVEAEDLPVPDLTNPDPLIAMRELLLFEFTASQLGGLTEYADVLAQQQTPAHDFYRRVLTTFENGGFRIDPLGEYQVLDVVEVDASVIVTTAGESVVDDAPPDAVFVQYTTSNGPYEIIDRDGELVQEEDGWEPRSLAAILNRTASGWKYYWLEGT